MQSIAIKCTFSIGSVFNLTSKSYLRPDRRIASPDGPGAGQYLKAVPFIGEESSSTGWEGAESAMGLVYHGVSTCRSEKSQQCSN